MSAQGVTPELVEEEIVRRVGLGAGAGLFGGLDQDALATIEIGCGSQLSNHAGR
jgi:hypothetical protein